MSDLQVNSVLPLTEMSSEELMSAFGEFLNIEVGAGDASDDTICTYICHLRQYFLWCRKEDIHPLQVTRNEIKLYRRWMVEAKRYKPATIALKLSTVRRFYDSAVEKGLMAMNPAVGVKPPPDKCDRAEKITYLEKSELKEFLKAIPRDGTLKSKRDLALLKIMALEGPRLIEMHRANIASLVQQGENLGIRVEGKRNIRVVPLTKAIAQELLDYIMARKEAGEVLSPESPLFIATGNRAGGKRLSRVGIRRIVDKYLKECNLKHRPGRTLSAHSLRHTAGTLALREGADLRQVQDLLGHADPRTTAIYAHVADRWENNPALRLEL